MVECQQLCNRVSYSVASHAVACLVLVLLGRASTVATSVAFMSSLSVTDDSETHYRGITALFS